MYLNEIQYKNQIDLDYKVEKLFLFFNFFTARHYGCLFANFNSLLLEYVNFEQTIHVILYSFL